MSLLLKTSSPVSTNTAVVDWFGNPWVDLARGATYTAAGGATFDLDGLILGGSGDYLTTTDAQGATNALCGSHARTLCAWVNPSNSTNTIFSHTYTTLGGSVGGWYVSLHSGAVRACIERSSIDTLGRQITTTATLSTSTWHHVACVYAATPSGPYDWTIYINGVAQGSVTSWGTPGYWNSDSGWTYAPTQYRVGADNRTGLQAWLGTIARLTIWKQALTAADINALFLQTRAGTVSTRPSFTIPVR